MKPALRKIKMQAATNLDEMLLLAENGEWRENVKPKHSKDAQNGWYRYDATFAFPVQGTQQAYKAYDAELVIRNASDGNKYLYDIMAIKENTGLALDLNEKARGRQKAAMQSGASVAEQSGNSDTSTANTSILTGGENVKPQFSLKAPVEAEKKGHVKSAKEFFGETNNWNETGYITTDGTKLDFSGRHDGAPGGQTGRRRPT